MKKILAIFIMIMFLIVPIFSEEQKEDEIFRALKTNFQIMGWTDLSVSYLTELHGLDEETGQGKFLLERPVLAIGVTVATDLAVRKVASLLYKENKTYGRIFIITMNTLRAYNLYRNFKAILDSR